MTKQEINYYDLRQWEYFYLSLAYDCKNEVLQWMYLFDYATYKYQADRMLNAQSF
jgi:hypothetical protein